MTYANYSYYRCEDLAEIIWANRQQIRQLEMIQEGLNIPPQVGHCTIMCRNVCVVLGSVFYHFELHKQ